VNLGFTSSSGTGPARRSGFYFTEYLSFYTADELADLPVPNPRVDVWVSLNQFIYQSNTPVLFAASGGYRRHCSAGVSFESRPQPPLLNRDGLVDILVGPFLQWDPIMGKNGPIFMHRVELANDLAVPQPMNEDKALERRAAISSRSTPTGRTLFITPKWTAGPAPALPLPLEYREHRYGISRPAKPFTPTSPARTS